MVAFVSNVMRVSKALPLVLITSHKTSAIHDESGWLSRYSDWATGWTSGVRFPAGAGIFFSSPPRPYRLWGPPSLLSNGYQGLFFHRGVKLSSHLQLEPRLLCGAISPLPQYVFMAWYLVKHRDSFTFTYNKGYLGLNRAAAPTRRLTSLMTLSHLHKLYSVE
jgi:hypothetical protein